MSTLTWTSQSPRPPMTVSCFCGDVGLPERASCGDEQCVEPEPTEDEGSKQ